MGSSRVKYLLDTNVWIDAIAGRLPADTFMRFTVEAEWAGYSAITRLELSAFPILQSQKRTNFQSF